MLDLSNISNLSIFIIIVIIILGIVGFIIIKDLLYLIDYIKFHHDIKIYNKNFKKYQEDKKYLLDKRLQQEMEVKKKYGLDYPEPIEEYLVGFAEPIGPNTKQEFTRQSAKYEAIAKAVQHMGENGLKNAYHRVMYNAAKGIMGKDAGKGQGRSR